MINGFFNVFLPSSKLGRLTHISEEWGYKGSWKGRERVQCKEKSIDNSRTSGNPVL
jgi:hypothetical protein